MGENKFFNILLISLGVIVFLFVGFLIINDSINQKTPNISFSSNEDNKENYFDIQLNSGAVEYGKDFSFKVNFEEITEENGYMSGVGSEYKYENLSGFGCEMYTDGKTSIYLSSEKDDEPLISISYHDKTEYNIENDI